MQKSEIEVMARSLMAEHGLFAKGWTFGFDRAVRRAGATHWRDHRITCSPTVMELWTEAGVRDMILHEIAHALCGPGVGHGPAWKQTHKSIGGNGQRVYMGYNADTKTQVKPKWISTAPCCGRTSTAHRRMNFYCGRCNKGRFTDEFRLVYTPND